jgi:F-type H+-transporting ATPase subunit b
MTLVENTDLRSATGSGSIAGRQPTPGARLGRWFRRAAVAVTLGVTFGACLVVAGGSPAWAAEEQAREPAAEIGHEHGEGRGEHGEGAPSVNGGKLALQFLNFGVLVAILVFFGGKAVNKALRARHEQLKADLASAAELRALAEAKLARQEARLGSLEVEIAELRRNLRAEAEAEKGRLIAAAEERAARIKTETGFLIDQQVREAEQRLRRESADAALKIAEDILRRAIGPADQRRLLDTFVGDVERTGPPAAGRGSGV